ncbi:MAG: SPOR domain-containing protein, partial [Fimbriimonadales bacterium]|nr:SPOR domain-containing protein [Fimbriimonadales bacterium]
MPLDFRTVDEDEGFSMKRFLRTMGLGVAVFLVFLALGYYVVGPRLTFTPEGIPRLRWRLDTPSAATSNQPPPPPKVEVYEKLPADVVAATGAEAGPREVAPFDYDRYLKRRARTRSPQPLATPETPPNENIPLDEEMLIVPDEPETAPTDVPADTPELPPSQEPSPAPQPEPSSPPAPSEERVSLYRVQVGVYEQRENANAVARLLLASGFEASIVPFQVNGRTRYRVQVLVTR